MRIRVLFLLVFIYLYNSIIISAQASVRLPTVISENMVLQQQSKISLWGWADSNESVIIEPNWLFRPVKAIANRCGEWNVVIKTPRAGGPYTLIIKGRDNTIKLNNILIGEVWVCSGQSNMWWPVEKSTHAEIEMPKANHPQIRLFTVPQAVSDLPLADCNAVWMECSSQTASKFSAVGYYFGLRLYENLNVPIGLIHTSWSGTAIEPWTKREVFTSDTRFSGVLKREAERLAVFSNEVKKYEKTGTSGVDMHKKPERITRATPGAIYNAMISPLMPYRIRGVIWYQGEANVKRAYHYRELFPAMIQNWRSEWGIGDFPFYFVQVAPYKYLTPELRESQFLTLKSVPNTGMAVTMDISEPNNIHPLNKYDVGGRLALWAMAKIYGDSDIEYSGPLYSGFKVKGNSIRIYFKHAKGLKAENGSLKHFKIAGDDKRFVPAEAVIDNDTVIVSSTSIKRPIAVRYAWSNEAITNLFNVANLPASPFRTDNWPVNTMTAR